MPSSLHFNLYTFLPSITISMSEQIASNRIMIVYNIEFNFSSSYYFNHIDSHGTKLTLQGLVGEDHGTWMYAIIIVVGAKNMFCG